jgi:hypothetical protein
MFNKNLVVVFLFITWIGYPCVIYAQVVEEWIARHNGFNGYGDIANAIAIDSSGYIYVTGSSWFDSLEGDCATIKYDSNGNEIWVVWYDGQPGNDFDKGLAITVDLIGNIYVTGESRDTVTGSDYFTVKYDSSGNEQWSARYNGPGDSTDIPAELAFDSFGNVYVTGRSWAHPDSFWDFDWATIKYDGFTGDTLWVRRYNGPGNFHDYAYDLVVDQEGSVYVIGRRSLLAGSEPIIIKYDSAGSQVWLKSDSVYSSNIILDSSNNFYTVGTFLQSNYDVGVFKYDKDGIELKRFQYDGGTDEGAGHLLFDNWGNIIVAGWSGILIFDYLTVKFDTAGNVLWVKDWNGPADDDDILTGLAIDPTGNVAVTGRTENGPSWLSDYATVKYDSSGNKLWEDIYDGPGNEDDEAYGVVMDASGNVYVTGFSDAGPPTGYDYTTIKYSDLTGVEENKIRIVKPEPFSISPNPFWNMTTIQGRGEFKVYDLMGRLRGKVKKGAFGRDLPAGVYIIQQGEKKLKLIKIK